MKAKEKGQASVLPSATNRPGAFPSTWLKWIPALAFPIPVAIGGRPLPAWVCMWAMAFALFAGAKWITICDLLFSKKRPGTGRVIGYLFLWPGLDARAFCGAGNVPSPPVREWMVAGAKTILGILLVWTGVRLLPASHPIIIGWAGMFGLILALHFGSFHLLSLLWRAQGINATPLMRAPAASTSLEKFWGGKWNAGFSDLTREHFFKPLAKKLGTFTALLGVFLISGLLHELVISLPARGGYGLPTLYFMIQGLGLLFERSAPGKTLELGQGWKGWCFVALIAGAPALLLFNPIFIRNVILPMLQAIGAT